MKRILVPNGNYTDIRLIDSFKKMGMYVITSGNDPSLIGHKHADEYAPHDYSDKEGMLELAKKLKIDYISACSNDFGVTTAAYIAENLHLPGHDNFVSSKIIAEKDLFKEFAMKNNLQVIPSHHFINENEALEFALKEEFPIIVKPTDLGGGKGVTKVTRKEDVKDAISLAFSKSKAKHIVIEPFIEGLQASFCTFLANKKVVSYTSFNEYDAYNNPFLVGYTTSPADDIDRVAKILIDETEKMAQLLDLVDGIFHIQYRMHKGQPLIMECMRRCLGNYSLRAASYMLGYKIEDYIAKSYCGFDCSDIPHSMNNSKSGYYCHYYIQPPKDGVVMDVEIPDEVKKYVYDSIMNFKPGDIVDNYKVQMVGFLFLKYPTLEERERISHNLKNLVKVIYK